MHFMLLNLLEGCESPLEPQLYRPLCRLPHRPRTQRVPTVRHREAPATLAGLWDRPAATSPGDFLLIILLVLPSGNSEPFPGVCRWTTLQVRQRP